MDGIVLGIDEAGRGPVIGNMFVVGVALRDTDLRLLSEMGVRDSKSLDRRRRETLYPKILEAAVAHRVVSYAPRIIDRENINTLFRRAVELIVREMLNILRGRLERVSIDLTGPPSILLDSIRNAGFHGEVRAVHRADSKYVEVAAASIVAKVMRDRHVDALKRVYGDFGSGYPSDPKTRTWLREWYVGNRSLPAIVRRSWKTIKQIAPSQYAEKPHSESLYRYL